MYRFCLGEAVSTGRLGRASAGINGLVCVGAWLLTDKIRVKGSHSLALVGAEPTHAAVGLSILKLASPGGL